MQRFTFVPLLLPLLLVGCASPRADALLDNDTSDAVPQLASFDLSELREDSMIDASSIAIDAVAETPAPAPTPLATDYEPSLLPAPSTFAPQEGGEKGLRENRITLKGGYYGSTEDAVDDGFIVGLSWMRFMNKWLAVEFELGYLDATGGQGAVDTDLWAVPIMLNGRVNVPAGPVDVYGGLGIGSFYYDAEASVGSLTVNAEGWLLAGNAFVGGSLNVADRIALGLEIKYYLTDEISDSGEGLDAVTVMLTLGFAH